MGSGSKYFTKAVREYRAVVVDSYNFVWAEPSCAASLVAVAAELASFGDANLEFTAFWPFSKCWPSNLEVYF